MSKIYIASFFLTASTIFSQEKDSAKLISEVRIDAYKKPVTLISSTKSVGIVSPDLLSLNTPERLLESVNQTPGARMEERSPGSYRIALRGSSLRSPFGVRNVKVYFDDFILTDASGNTYFNIISPELINRIEIFKGPESGDFGAATGGTLLLKTTESDTKTAGFSVGSYGTFNESFQFSKKFKKHFLHVFQNYYRTDSYRQQSAVDRKQIFIKDHYNYSSNGTLKTMLLLTDLKYQTPGGLTLEQLQINRKQARPSTKTVPGAAEQDAGIQNKMVLAGLSNEIKFAGNLSHFIVLQGSYVDFENPFITNFENRFENNLALRTHFNYDKNWAKVSAQWRVGFEGGKNSVFIKNFDNNKGYEGNPQNFDRLKNTSGFYFISQKLNFNEKLFTDISMSLNMNSYRWEKIFPVAENGSKKFENQLLPNFGVTYLISKNFSVRGKIGKGNSAPTSDEIRSSTQQFNLNIAPEYGWNKEIGLRKQFGNYLFAEAAYFDFRMKDAIVRRQNELGQEFFVNAGETVQKGFEAQLETARFSLSNDYFSHVKLRISGSFYNFKFENYRQNNSDFSGNDLTGVPRTTVNSVLSFSLFKKLEVDYSQYYTSKIPLNDANAVWSESSFVGNIQFKYPFKIDNSQINLFLQIQNIFNEEYVLGFDINAFGNRYYNPAAKRNFVMGVKVDF
ncbi:TonB-dependent receptor [Chryseobacterium sp. Leaf180]|uniref:TonB-dependent receptor n=1 Tax=Chryseobacterium sp. Leaf180 TaxID=1736289 RepID=UPI0006F3C957|nr:TonB-dependent receptor [Chryseobacterium sp. Leaf180]KQR92724.1 TonB-dependent receptor [Chryseobacterium sp. Leaf180]